MIADAPTADPLPAIIVRELVNRYDIPEETSVRFVRHGENTTYLVASGGEPRYALRVHRPGYQSVEAIASELAWMTSLRASGVLTPVAVPGADGDPVQTVDVNGSVRSGVLFEWIDGRPLSAIRELDPWRRLGELMGRLHNHGSTWQPPDGFTRPAWDADALVGDRPRWGLPDPDGVFAAHHRAALDECRAEVKARLDAIGVGPDRFGLIHGDLGFENVLVGDDGAITIIDFDDSGPGWYVHELAVALYPHEGTPGLSDRCGALVAGYRTVRELPDELLLELPTFLMARRIATLGWVFSRAETAHAQRQRPGRIATTPQATRDYLTWSRKRSV